MKFFKEDFDKDIKRPADYPYLQFIRYNLLFLTSWPGKQMGENVYKYRFLWVLAVKFMAFFYLISEMYFLWKNKDKISFYDKGHMFITLLMTTVLLLRIFLTNMQNCQDIVVIYLTKMHLFQFKNISDFALQTHKKIHFITHSFTLYLSTLSLLGMTSFNLIPMYKNYALGKFNETFLLNMTYEHSIYIALPFDIYTNFHGYWIGVLFNWFSSYLCTAWFVIWDLLMCSIVFNLWGHYNILLHDLGSFPLPADKRVVTLNERGKTVVAQMYSEDEMKHVSQKLKACIDYHRNIAEYTFKISNAFGPMLLLFLIFHQTCGCLLLLECSQMTTEALLAFGPLSVILFQQLIQMSVIFELIGSASEKLKDAVYEVPWEFMDINNRKTVAIFLINVQEPVHVKAMGIANVGVTSMAAILKTSFTYFTFLRSM